MNKSVVTFSLFVYDLFRSMAKINPMRINELQPYFSMMLAVTQSARNIIKLDKTVSRKGVSKLVAIQISILCVISDEKVVYELFLEIIFYLFIII